jgi:hypothetical protein
LVNPAEYETEHERDGDIENHHQYQGHWHLPFEPIALGCPRKVTGPFSRGDFGKRPNSSTVQGAGSGGCHQNQNTTSSASTTV